MSRQIMNRWNNIASASVKPNIVKEQPKKPEPEIVALSPEIIESRRHAQSVVSDLEIARKYLNKNNDAAQRGISFSLTYPEFYKICATPVCPYSGKYFSSDGKGQEGMTMERINPTLGYTPENTIAVTLAANGQKAKLDQFVKDTVILPEMKIKLLRKALYQLEKAENIRKGNK